MLGKKRKKSEVVSEEVKQGPTIEANELEVPSPPVDEGRVKELQDLYEGFARAYPVYSPQDFGPGVFESEVCNLLFAILQELKGMKED